MKTNGTFGPRRFVQGAGPTLAFAALAAVLFGGGALPSQAAGPRLKALIVDGQNNHDWKSTTPVLKDILESSRRFSVEVATSPPGGGDMSTFNPRFDGHDVVVSNYTGDMWSDRTREAFLRYVRGGGGVVIFHAANNAFPQWPEWNEVIGLGGWGGRNERSGPYVYWKGGRVVRDNSPGSGGAHGPAHAFEVINRVTDHPITRGLPTRWRHMRDELYGTLRGPAKNMTILSTAWSPRDKGGQDRHEPILMTIEYGRGRVFHTVLGHDTSTPMQCVGFRVTLLRGTEWAATGRVTFPVPGNFPAVLEPIDALAAYDFGRPVEPLSELRGTIERESGDRARMSEYEGRFVAMLGSTKTSFAAKQFICQQLAFMGTRRSVPALKKMLSGNVQDSAVARTALQQMSSSEANEALLDGLRSARGPSRIGIMNSLGVRADGGSVSALARLTGDRDAATAAAAVGALGRIGDSSALKALERARGVPERVLDDALVRCAYTVALAGKGRDAARVFDRILAKDDAEKSLRVAALSGLLIAAPERAMQKFWKQLETDDPAKIAAVASILGRTPPETALVKTITSRLGRMPARAQAALLAVLGAWGHPAAVPEVVVLVREGTNKDLRLAAVDALGKLKGTRDSVKTLASLAAGTERDVRDRARAALVATGGTEAEDTIIAGLEERDESLQAEYVRAAGGKRLARSGDALLRLAGEAGEDVRIAALKALRNFAGAKEYRALIRLASKAPSKKVMGEAVSTVTRAGREVADDADRAEPFLRAMRRGNEAMKIAFLKGLAYINGREALEAAKEYARSPSEPLSDAAVRALAKWQYPAALGTILDVATSTRNKVHRILLMRGFGRLLPLANDMNGDEKLALCEKALKIGLETEAMRLLISTIADIGGRRALDLIDSMSRKPELKKDAALAGAIMMQKFIGSPKLTASANGSKAALAVDGNAGTRWDSGATMRPGVWLMADLGLTAEVRAVVLDASGSPKDYPRGYEVYVTDDGSANGLPVASGKGNGPVTAIPFDRPAKGRYVKVVQTGSNNASHWSVHEVYVNYITALAESEQATVKLDDLLRGDGLIKEWNVAGPYTEGDKDAKDLFDVTFGPELGDGFAKWARVEARNVGGGAVDFNSFMRGYKRVVYVRTVIVADEATDATLGLGSDDGIKAWLNGKLVHGENAVRGHSHDQAKVRVHLERGRNLLLLKVTQGGGDWKASARIRR